MRSTLYKNLNVVLRNIEKEYNEPAKAHGGISSITREKILIIKHKKARYTKFAED